MAVIEKDLGPVSAYAVAVAHGYTGTEAEWEALIANSAINAQSAGASATAAAASAQEAAQQKTQAQAQAAAALAHAQDASRFSQTAGQANSYAQMASSNAAHSATNASNAQTAAEAAQAAAEAAVTGAEAAQTAAEAAVTDAQTAKTAAETAAATAAAAYGTDLLADDYSTSKTYAVGDYVIYSGNLYRCTTAIVTAESWTAAHWTQAQVGPDLNDLKSAFDVHGHNIYDSLHWNKTDLVNSGYISAAGQPKAGSAFGYTDAIKIPKGAKQIRINRHGNFTGCAIAFYKTNAIEAASFISGVTSPGNVKYNESPITAEVPSDAVYFAFSSRVDTATVYDFDGQIDIDWATFSESLALQTDVNNIITELGTYDFTLAEDLTVTGSYIDSAGNLQASADWCVSNLIELPQSCNGVYVTKCYPLGSTNLNIAFYSENKTFISGSQLHIGTGLANANPPTTIEKPANAVYVRFCTHLNDSSLSQRGFNASLVLSGIVEDLYNEINKAKQGNAKRQLICDVISPLMLGTKNYHVKLIGDSITAGVGGTGYDPTQSGGGEWIYQGYYSNIAGYCWANLLKEYWESKLNCTVYNFGMSGRKSGNLIQGLNAWLHADDDIVICMIGTNDRNVGESDPITGGESTTTTLYNNLCTLVESVQNAGKKIILMSNIPAYNETGQNFHMEDVDHVIMKVASDYNMEYVSVYSLMMEYCKYTGTALNTLLTDGLHPNDAGYLVMFRLITEALSVSPKREDATW